MPFVRSKLFWLNLVDLSRICILAAIYNPWPMASIIGALSALSQGGAGGYFGMGCKDTVTRNSIRSVSRLENSNSRLFLPILVENCHFRGEKLKILDYLNSNSRRRIDSELFILRQHLRELLYSATITLFSSTLRITFLITCENYSLLSNFETT